MFAILNHTCILSTWSLLSNNEIWAQSSNAFRNQKVIPVWNSRRCEFSEHPLILNILFVIDCGDTPFFFFSFFYYEKTFRGNFFWGGERDDVDERTSVSSIIYSKEIDNWIINWPTDTASPIFSCPLNATCFWYNLWQLKGLCHGSPVHFV